MKQAIYKAIMWGSIIVLPKQTRKILLNIYNRTYDKIKRDYVIFIKKHCKSRYADYLFKKAFGRKIDWKHPRDLNEKIQYLMFKTDTSEWSRLADKYAVRDFIKEKGLKDILVPLYGKWDRVEDIDWDSLPEQYVLKTNHGSGCTIVIKDKRDIDKLSIENKLNESLKQHFGDVLNEPHYNRIKPCIIAEQYLNNGEDGLIDYKIWCLDGIPDGIYVIYGRTNEFMYTNYYDTEWNTHPEYCVFSKHYRNGGDRVPRPKNLEKMLEYATILAEGHPQVRVDFYEVDGKIYFGEMTFTSAAGRMDYFTQEQLIKMGDKVTI